MKTTLEALRTSAREARVLTSLTGQYSCQDMQSDRDSLDSRSGANGREQARVGAGGSRVGWRAGGRAKRGWGGGGKGGFCSAVDKG